MVWRILEEKISIFVFPKCTFNLTQAVDRKQLFLRVALDSVNPVQLFHLTDQGPAAITDQQDGGISLAEV